MTQIKEGNYKKGGINPPPTTKRPNITPKGRDSNRIAIRFKNIYATGNVFIGGTIKNADVIINAIIECEDITAYTSKEIIEDSNKKDCLIVYGSIWIKDFRIKE